MLLVRRKAAQWSGGKKTPMTGASNAPELFCCTFRLAAAASPRPPLRTDHKHTKH